jgi:TolB-like protein
MSLSEIFFVKHTALFLVLCVGLSGCAGPGKAVPVGEEALPSLTVQSLTPDKAAPQAARMTVIRWSAAAEGGAGNRTYEFRHSDGTEEIVVQKGPSPTWDWAPEKAGTYQTRVIVQDLLGHQVESEWSPEYDVVPELLLDALSFDKVPPQAALMTTIRWTAQASGGVGRLTYLFSLSERKEGILVKEGLSPVWDWLPKKAGAYRMKLTVRDELGNSKEYEWPAVYEVAPELVLHSLMSDKQGTLASGKTTVCWTVSITGGVGALTYEFISFDGNEEIVLQAGPSPALDWMPDKPGIYKIRVVVRDELGNQVESGWSEEFEIVTKLVTGSLVAVFPFENYNLRPVPVREIRESYLNKLKSAGLEILPEDVLEKFMARHRIRHAGGISGALSEALREETGAEGLMISTLEFYDDGPPPLIVMASRLVSAGREQKILWMKSIGLTGDDARGLLDLGRIKDPGVLRDKAEQILADSLHDYLSEWREPVPGEVETRFSPKIAYRSPLLHPERRYTVAVVPFFNRSQRDYAGEIMTLQFVEKLSERKGFEVLDPGDVRQKLLGYRVIMYEGLSLGDADLLFEFLDVDLIVTGNVLDYQDALRGAGKPKVDFSAVMIERESREVVWSSKNYNQGDDKVFFFDWGKMRTAHAMASGMVRSVVDEMVRLE